MLFRLSMEHPILVRDFYKIRRNTVWSQADQNHILVAVTEGECIFTIEGEDYLVGRGDLFFIPANQLYRRRPQNGAVCEFFYVHFSADDPAEAVEEEIPLERARRLRSEIFADLTRSDYRTSVLSTDAFLAYSNHAREYTGDILGQLEAALEEVLRGDVESSMLISLRVSLVLVLLTRCCFSSLLSGESTAVDGRYPARIKKALLYIRQNYTRKITLEELSRYCSVTPQHLARLFREELQISPIQYINRLKISYSKELLRTTSLSVKEVADHLGFENASYFSRLFHKLEGIYPTDFRLRLTVYQDTDRLPCRKDED